MLAGRGAGPGGQCSAHPSSTLVTSDTRHHHAMYELVDTGSGDVVNVVALDSVLEAVAWFFAGKAPPIVSITAAEAVVICDGRKWLVRRASGPHGPP